MSAARPRNQQVVLATQIELPVSDSKILMAVAQRVREKALLEHAIPLFGIPTEDVLKAASIKVIANECNEVGGNIMTDTRNPKTFNTEGTKEIMVRYHVSANGVFGLAAE